MNYDALSRDLKRSKPTIINYISYLEYALILRRVRNLRPGLMATSRKMRKVYPTNVAFARIFAPESSPGIGRVIETVILQELDAEYYFRDNTTEIDFILKNGRIVPVEVKYGKKVELKQFTRALNKIGLDYGFVITRDIYKEEKINGKRILMVPAWAFVLFKDEFIR